MKYEMILGDEGLADKFTNENSVFIVCCGHGIYFEFESGNAGVNYVINNFLIGDSFYMRRIIKEPKRWTWEDKKAGRLPEVGCNVDTFTGECVVIGRDSNLKHVAVQYHDDGHMDILHISKITPIETQSEKAQREEDEFVDVIVSEYNKMPSSISFKAGVRAAYRKLKGGE